MIGGAGALHFLNGFRHMLLNFLEIVPIADFLREDCPSYKRQTQSVYGKSLKAAPGARVYVATWFCVTAAVPLSSWFRIRARLQPCRNWRQINTALAAEGLPLELSHRLGTIGSTSILLAFRTAAAPTNFSETFLALGSLGYISDRHYSREGIP
jgi:hypothetical protein